MNRNVKLISLAAACTAVSGNAFAADDLGNPADAFAGVFAGLGVGFINAETSGDDSGGGYAANSTPTYTGFVGYNWVHGDYIIGAEVSAFGGETSTIDGDDYGVRGIYDLKLRAGRTFEMAPNTQFYLSAGIFHAELTHSENFEARGLSVGAGFETNITENVFIAVDGTARFATDIDDNNDEDKDVGEIYTLAARVGFRF